MVLLLLIFRLSRYYSIGFHSPTLTIESECIIFNALFSLTTGHCKAWYENEKLAINQKQGILLGKLNILL